MKNLVSLKTFNNDAEAELVKNILEDNGIDALVKADDCAGMVPFLQFGSGGVHLLVFEEDVEKAQEMLKKIEEEFRTHPPDINGESEAEDRTDS